MDYSRGVEKRRSGGGVRVGALVVLGAVVLSSAAEAQPQARVRPNEPAATPETTPQNLRGRFGMELVQRLLRSSTPEDRLRGIRRAAEQGTPEAIALLASQAESNAQVRTDARALLEVARALASHAAEEGPRAALVSILNVQTSTARSYGPDDADPQARFELARATAALALAESGVGAAMEALIAAVRAQSVGTDAATRALAAAPPSTIRGLGPAASLSPAVLSAIAKTEDLRAADILLLALSSSEPRAKSLAVVALAQKGDVRALEPAKVMAKDASPQVRVAGTQALVALASKEAAPALKALLGDESTAPSAVELLPLAENEELVKLVGARATAHPVHGERLLALAALSRCGSVAAAKAIGSLVLDKTVESEAAQALGRSRSPHVDPWIVAMLRAPQVRNLGARAYVLRVLRGAPRIAEADGVLRQLAAAREPAPRAVGVFGLVATGLVSPESKLGDPSPEARAAAAMGARGKLDDDLRETMLRRAVSERDPATRTALFTALASGDPSGIVPSPLLVDRAESGAPEAALAAFALARRSEEEPTEKVKGLLASRTNLVRDYALLGLSSSKVRDVSGRIASAYQYEPDPVERLWLVRALATRSGDADARVRKDTLTLAAKLDPSPEVRFVARRAALGIGIATTRGEADEIAWLRVSGPDGRPPAESGFTGTLLASTGETIVVAFDPEGYALVPQVPPGETRILLAPRFAKESR